MKCVREAELSGTRGTKRPVFQFRARTRRALAVPFSSPSPVGHTCRIGITSLPLYMYVSRRLIYSVIPQKIIREAFAMRGKR
jgi:hypothetical protein